MKVLKPNSELLQQIFIIPREYSTNVLMDFRDEETNEVITYNPIDSISGDYLFLSGQFEGLKESRFYDVTFYDKFTLKVIHKDKVFCTAQEINQNENKYYTINKDVYKEDESFNNDYIVI